jgi:hypothetical protein
MLTIYFSESEFLPAKIGNWNSLPARGKYMAAVLASTLETIRDAAREKVPGAVINLNSGIRPPEHNAKIGGSKTSDHLFGIPNDLSVGAADIVCPQMDAAEFFNLCLNLRYSGKIRTGQILLEKNNSFWVHIANDPALFLTSEQMSLRSEFSLYGIAWNFQNGKSGHWNRIDWENFYSASEK